MEKLKCFSEWMNNNSRLSDSSIYKYTRAVNTISNEMIDKNVIHKSLLDMDLLELDFAIINILDNDYFTYKNKKGNYMYSNALKQFRYYMLECADNYNYELEIEKQILQSEELDATEKQILIKSRIGQGKYRENLIKKYDGKCVVTGIDNAKLLVASHIKPWAICENNERIDTENGLLLSPNMDRLFDSGLITFNNVGKMYISSFIGEQNINRLHISRDMHVNLRVTERLLSYLEYHRDVLFVK